MPVPDFQTLMLPLLQLVSDGHEHNLSDAIDQLILEFSLSESEQQEVLPSGRQTRFENRIGWAKTYLSKAGLLESTGRGRFRISNRGKEVLSNRPERIDLQFLSRYPEFQDFRGKTSPQDNHGVFPSDSNQTPEENLEASYQSLRLQLAQDLLQRVKASAPRFFEKLVVDLLVAMGYGGTRKDAGQAVGQSGDGGIDGIIKEDKLGLDAVYIQAKRWEGVVGRPVVQAFVGSLDGHRARKGVMITTSHFSQEARDYTERIEKKVVLIDGEQLAQLMIDHNVGVNEVAKYVVKKVDLDYFDEGR